MQANQISTLTSDEVRQIIREELASLKPVEKKETTPKYYSRQELSKRFGASLVTIDKWSNEGILKKYSIGGKIRFKASEVEKALVEVKNLSSKR